MSALSAFTSPFTVAVAEEPDEPTLVAGVVTALGGDEVVKEKVVPYVVP